MAVRYSFTYRCVRVAAALCVALDCYLQYRACLSCVCATIHIYCQLGSQIHFTSVNIADKYVCLYYIILLLHIIMICFSICFPNFSSSPCFCTFPSISCSPFLLTLTLQPLFPFFVLSLLICLEATLHSVPMAFTSLYLPHLLIPPLSLTSLLESPLSLAVAPGAAAAVFGSHW